MSRARASRSHSRVPLSRAESHSSSVIILPGGAETLVIPEAPIGASVAELLGDPPQHQVEGTSTTLVEDTGDGQRHKVHTDDGEETGSFVPEDEDEIQELEERMKRPFYRRPSPWWVLATVSVSAIAFSATMAPRVEIYTKLACQALRPEYAIESLDTLAGPGTVTPPSIKCGQDSDVQAAVAKLITILTVSMGLLSCLTTGWWGQLSDRYGRTRIIGIAVVGLLATDVNFILVSLASDRLPGGYRFLLVGPILDGLFGGMATLTAALHAYVSDCTPPEARSRIFSLNIGLIFIGMALGPTVGGLLIRVTNNLLSVFYLATASHVFYGFLILFIIPESLTKSSMRKARKRRETIYEEAAAAELAASHDRGFMRSVQARIWSFIKKLFVFLAPLAIFLPFKHPDRRGWNWNLTLLVLSYMCSGLLMGSFQFKFQYAQKAFGWDSEAMGYWLSMVGVVRATYLVVILPLILKYLKPKVAPIQLPVSPSEPLRAAQSSSTSNVGAGSRTPEIQRPTLQTKAKHPPSFDLTLARVSLVIELISYAGMTLALSSTSWTVATLFEALGGGFSPAVQSVALALYERGSKQGMETGRLFGGLSVVQALSMQIVGPSLLGFTYVSTVNTFPKGIFVVCGSAVVISLLFMSCVRLPKTPQKEGHDREETVVENVDPLVA